MLTQSAITVEGEGEGGTRVTLTHSLSSKMSDCCWRAGKAAQAVAQIIAETNAARRRIGISPKKLR